MRARGTAARSLALAATALMVAGSTALGALRFGTDGPDTLVGSSGADAIAGKGGDDVLKGLGGDDIYYFTNGGGRDTLEEKARYKVDGKVVPGGVDTLSFARMKAMGNEQQVWVTLVRQWGPNHNRGGSLVSDGTTVALGRSVVENVTGMRSVQDFLFGGGEANRLDTGGGANDALTDYGGWNDGAAGWPELPVSNDTFLGAAANTGTVWVKDWAGDRDVLDLRPLASTDVYLDAVDMDETPDEKESLLVATGDESVVVVLGHFGDFLDLTTTSGQRGQVERLVFKDRTLDTSAIDGFTTGRTARSTTGAALAAASDRLAAAAREDLERHPRTPGGLPEPTAGSATAAGRDDRAGEPATRRAESPSPGRDGDDRGTPTDDRDDRGEAGGKQDGDRRR